MNAKVRLISLFGLVIILVIGLGYVAIQNKTLSGKCEDHWIRQYNELLAYCQDHGKATTEGWLQNYSIGIRGNDPQRHDP